MHTSTLLMFLLFVLLIVVIAVAINRHHGGSMYDDEITHTVTTTTYANGPTLSIVGTLARQYDGSQPFVIDPVDGDKTWLNTKDDMYEDGGGKVWRLA